MRLVLAVTAADAWMVKKNHMRVSRLRGPGERGSAYPHMGIKQDPDSVFLRAAGPQGCWPEKEAHT